VASPAVFSTQAFRRPEFKNQRAEKKTAIIMATSRKSEAAIFFAVFDAIGIRAPAHRTDVFASEADVIEFYHQNPR
jgi:hypothetical protein